MHFEKCSSRCGTFKSEEFFEKKFIIKKFEKFFDFEIRIPWSFVCFLPPKKWSRRNYFFWVLIFLNVRSDVIRMNPRSFLKKMEFKKVRVQKLGDGLFTVHWDFPPNKSGFFTPKKWWRFYFFFSNSFFLNSSLKVSSRFREN